MSLSGSGPISSVDKKVQLWLIFMCPGHTFSRHNDHFSAIGVRSAVKRGILASGRTGGRICIGIPDEFWFKNYRTQQVFRKNCETTHLLTSAKIRKVRSDLNLNKLKSCPQAADRSGNNAYDSDIKGPFQGPNLTSVTQAMPSFWTYALRYYRM